MDIDLNVTKKRERHDLVVSKMADAVVDDRDFSIKNLALFGKNVMLKVEAMQEEANSFRATSANKDDATERGAQAKKLATIFDKKRKAYKEPYLRHGKEIDSVLMPIVKALREVEKTMGIKLSKVLHREAEKKRLEEAARRAAEEEAAKAAAKLTKQKIAPPVASQPAAAPVKRVQAETGSAGLKYKPEFKLTGSLADVDPKYLQLNEEALAAAYKAGSRGNDIKGIEIVKVPVTSFANKRS